MPFTELQRDKFVRALQSRGWVLERDVIWSPGRGLYFNDSHFMHWSPAEMCEVFTRRGDRIRKAAFEGWERSVAEHCEVCAAAKEVTNA